jgi:hypothetical protein
MHREHERRQPNPFQNKQADWLFKDSGGVSEAIAKAIDRTNRDIKRTEGTTAPKASVTLKRREPAA